MIVERGTGAVRIAAWGGVVGPILFAVLVVIGGSLYDGYSHTSQKISELGGAGSEYALLQNLNFALLGILVIGFSWALARHLVSPSRGPLLIGVFGLVAIIHSRLPCDIGCQGQTTTGLLHNVSGMAGFISAVIGMFVLARLWRDDPLWDSHARFTRGAGFVALGGLLWFVATQALDMQSLAGVAQRVFAGTLLFWISATGIRLLRQVSATSLPTPTS